MNGLEIEIVPALTDNYVYLIHDGDSDKTAAIDPSEPEVVAKALGKKGWNLTHIFNTHHHWDHTGGNLALKKKTGCAIVGFAGDSERIPGIDREVSDGDIYKWGGYNIKIMHIPGHTTGAIAFYFEEEGVIFSGDTLFTMGCGRLFEGTPEMMFESLSKLTLLPKETKVYSGHEYAEGLARFALTLEPKNKALKERFQEVVHLLDMGSHIQPSTIEEELATNPFLRWGSKEIRKKLKMKNATDLEVFTEVRKTKDNF